MVSDESDAYCLSVAYANQRCFVTTLVVQVHMKLLVSRVEMDVRSFSALQVLG